MTLDRFAYGANLERMTSHRERSHASWPPAYDYRLSYLDLANEIPALGAGLHAELATLRAAVEAEWRHAHDAAAIARCLRRIAELLPGEADRRALGLRADVVERGYANGTLSALAAIDEDITIVAGKLTTWCGKQASSVPTAFGCVRDTAAQASVTAARARLGDITAYLLGLHEHLRLGEVPAFTATRLFFMGGEGDRHPKHIAYFLPEGERREHRPFERTYYFANTHRALIDAVSLPLGRRLLNLGLRLPASAASFGAIPALGVLAHQVGRSVFHEGAFVALDAADRWASDVLAETAAGVLGTVVLAELLAPRLGLEPSDVIAYHLVECLRYVDRGLGNFPDSDAAYLQLNYLVSSGALALEGGVPRLTGEPAAVIDGFRSMARALADTLLAGQVDDALAFYRAYCPAGGHALHPLLVALREEPPQTIEYLQEPRITARAREASPPVEPSAANLARDALHEFYCRPVGGTTLNRYEIWERGGAVGDSVTPSIYCPEYRTHMGLKILSLPKPHERMFSIGCGNAFVEADLQARGLRVQAIDCNQEAVVLAASKGVDAFAADYYALPPGYLADIGLVYADGLVGHLYQPDTGLTAFFEALVALKPPPGSWLVLSNDAPAEPGCGVAPHGKVHGFWLFSPEYLRDAALRFGYTVTEAYSFPYERPLSGLRNRTICIARVASPGGK